MLIIIPIAFALWLAGRWISKLIKSRTSNPTEADAIILRMEETGFFNGNKPRVKIQVQVFPDKGRNFVTELRESLQPSQLELIKPGGRVRILYSTPNHGHARLLELLF